MRTARLMFTSLSIAMVLALCAAVVSALHQTAQDRAAQVSIADADANDAVVRDARRMIRDGRQVFRFDTFGDEAFWGDALQLHRAIEGEKLGSVGPGVSPRTALAVGLKVDATVRTVLKSWGPGKFDAELVLDGKAFRPDGGPAATLIPPAFGLAGVNLHTWTGWGSVTHWNAFVATLEMHGRGTFFDPRLDNADQFPLAAAHGFGHVRNDQDDITPKLAPLHFYQLAIRAPRPPRGSFDRRAAARGDELFSGKAQCNSCQVKPLWTEPGWNLHSAQELGLDDFQANRAPDRAYHTSPLAGLWTHTNESRVAAGMFPVKQGGFFHDARFATLLDVVNHYDQVFGLGLTDQEKRDLVEYIKSL